MIKHEGLDNFVRRILREKQLTLSEVERRAEGQISDSYVCGISTGSIRNLTIDKLKALARGLGVAETQLFAACGVSLTDREEFSDTEFAQLFCKYRELSIEHKRLLDAFLGMLDREIDRLLLLSDPPEQQHPLSPTLRNTLSATNDSFAHNSGNRPFKGADQEKS
jgi:transcriptional regulator with XRE-family HTH domain